MDLAETEECRGTPEFVKNWFLDKMDTTENLGEPACRGDDDPSTSSLIRSKSQVQPQGVANFVSDVAVASQEEGGWG